MEKIASLFSILALISLSFASSFATFSFMNVALAASDADSSQELSIKEATESSNVKSEDKKVEYQLPYPGLLPDSPLYFLKMVRDRIVGFLISDPLKKAEFDLLAADKRLNAGIYLLNKDKSKSALAYSTISKGENYFEEAIKNVREAKKQGMDTNDIIRRLSDSSYKHQEVLTMLRKKAPKELKESFMSLEKRAKDLRKQVESLKPKK